MAIFNGTSAGDTLRGGAEDDTLNGLGGDDFLYGNAGNDTLSGGDGSDQLFGGPGNDTIDGGTGALDYARYDNASGAVTVNLALGTASGADGVDSLLNLDGVTGSAFADTLVGSGNNDFIEGGLGNDHLDGGLGVDYLGHQLATAGVTVSLASGATAGAAGNDVLLGFENVGGSPFNDFLTGDSGNNILEGMTGDDVLDGGIGDDGASYYHAGGGVIVTLNQGATPGDANGADGHDVLLNMENLYGSQYADTLIGNSANNHINGYDDDDVIDGGGGVDTLVGGLGRDRFVLRPLEGTAITITDFQVGIKADGLDVSQLLADSASRAAYNYRSDPFAAGILRVQQSASNAVLQWDADGIGPKDWQTLAILENITVASLLLQNYVGVPVLGGDQAEVLVGDIWSDVIIAGGGDDTLNGGGSSDRMEGGKAADTYYVDDPADQVLEADNALGRAPGLRPGLDLGSAIDKVIASVTFSLGAFVENLDLATGAGDLAGTGNALDNVLLGNDGRNSLAGLGGNDSIDGGAGDDRLSGNAGDDTVAGGDGRDRIYGDHGNDALSGGADKDMLYGGAGNDTVEGGTGADTIMGGAGDDILAGNALIGGDLGLVDVFKWELGDEGNKGAPASDVIKDWDNASANVSTGVGGDVLDLRDLLIGEHSATNLDDFLHFELSGANTIVHVSATGEFASGYNAAKEVQTITLENTDLFAAGTLNTDQQIINDLLTKGKLITD